MFQDKKIYTTQWAGKELTVELGEMARQANAAVVVKYGDTVVLTTAVASKEAKDVDFFPLTVNYEEKMYAVGKIPGGFLRREGRPGTEATLAARLIDRPIRPLFEDGFRNEVQVISTVLSVEYDCDPVMAAMLGSSLALSVSNIPFKGPIAGVTVGYVDGEYVINPNVEQFEKSKIDLKVAGTKDAINMVEAGAEEVSEEVMLNAIMFGHEEIKRLIAFQQQIVDEIGQEKMEVELKVIDENIYNEVLELSLTEMKSAIAIKDKQERDEAISVVKERVLAVFEERATDEDELDIVKEAKLSLDKIVKEIKDLNEEGIKNLLINKAILDTAKKYEFTEEEFDYFYKNEKNKFFIAKLIENKIVVNENDVTEIYTKNKANFDAQNISFSQAKEIIQRDLLNQQVATLEAEELDKLVQEMEDKVEITKEEILFSKLFSFINALIFSKISSLPSQITHNFASFFTLETFFQISSKSETHFQ